MKQKLLVVLMGLGLMTLMGCKGGSQEPVAFAPSSALSSIKSSQPSSSTVTLKESTSIAGVYAFHSLKYNSVTKEYEISKDRPTSISSAYLAAEIKLEDRSKAISAYLSYMGSTAKFVLDNPIGLPSATLIPFLFTFEQSGDTYYVKSIALTSAKLPTDGRCVVVAYEQQATASTSVLDFGALVEQYKAEMRNGIMVNFLTLLEERLSMVIRREPSSSTSAATINLEGSEGNVVIIIGIQRLNLAGMKDSLLFAANAGDLSRLNLSEAVEATIVLVNTHDLSGRILGDSIFIAINSGKMDIILERSVLVVINSAINLSLDATDSQIYLVNSVGELEMKLISSGVSIADSTVNGLIKLDHADMSVSNSDVTAYVNKDGGFLSLINLFGVSVSNNGWASLKISDASNSTFSVFANDNVSISGGTGNDVLVLGSGYTGTFDFSSFFKSLSI